MKRIPLLLIVFTTVALAAFAARAISAQDKYTLQVPSGLSFAEFRGYEDWQVVSISQTEIPQIGELIEVILANPVMIEAYRAGIDGPDGSKMAKIIRRRRRASRRPRPRRCRIGCTMSISWSGTANDLQTPAHGDTRSSTTTPRPMGSCRSAPAPNAASPAIRACRPRTTYSPPTRSADQARLPQTTRAS
jgi:Cytochrome P460